MNEELPVIEEASIPPAISQPPRVWTAIVAGLLGWPAAGLVGAAVLAAVTWSVDFEREMATPSGFLIVVAATELAAVAITWSLARRSTTPIRERLALWTPRLRWWAWPLLAVATLAAHLGAILLVASLLGDPPPEMLERFEVLSGITGAQGALLLVLASVLPGIAEELLFRGYVQSRLEKRWSPAAAIGLAAFFFAIAHGYPYYAAVVFPTGLWLGWVAWKMDTIVPSMFCHFVINFTLVAQGLLAGDANPQEAWVTWDGPTIALACACAVTLVVSVPILARHARVPEPPLVLEADPPPDEALAP